MDGLDIEMVFSRSVAWQQWYANANLGQRVALAEKLFTLHAKHRPKSAFVYVAASELQAALGRNLVTVGAAESIAHGKLAVMGPSSFRHDDLNHGLGSDQAAGLTILLDQELYNSSVGFWVLLRIERLFAECVSDGRQLSVAAVGQGLPASLFKDNTWRLAFLGRPGTPLRRTSPPDSDRWRTVDPEAKDWLTQCFRIACEVLSPSVAGGASSPPRFKPRILSFLGKDRSRQLFKRLEGVWGDIEFLHVTNAGHMGQTEEISDLTVECTYDVPQLLSVDPFAFSFPVGLLSEIGLVFTSQKQVVGPPVYDVGRSGLMTGPVRQLCLAEANAQLEFVCGEAGIAQDAVVVAQFRLEELEDTLPQPPSFGVDGMWTAFHLGVFSPTSERSSLWMSMPLEWTEAFELRIDDLCSMAMLKRVGSGWMPTALGPRLSLPVEIFALVHVLVDEKEERVVRTLIRMAAVLAAGYPDFARHPYVGVPGQGSLPPGHLEALRRRCRPGFLSTLAPDGYLWTMVGLWEQHRACTEERFVDEDNDEYSLVVQSDQERIVELTAQWSRKVEFMVETMEHGCRIDTLARHSRWTCDDLSPQELFTIDRRLYRAFSATAGVVSRSSCRRWIHEATETTVEPHWTALADTTGWQGEDVLAIAPNLFIGDIRAANSGCFAGALTRISPLIFGTQRALPDAGGRM